MSPKALLLFEVARSLPGLSLDSSIPLLVFEASTSGLWASDTSMRAIAARAVRVCDAATGSVRALRGLPYEKSMHLKHA